MGYFFERLKMEEKMIERIVRLIDEKGMSDKELCELAGIKQSTFATWKQAGRNPGAEYVSGIASAFGVSEKYILTGEDLDVIDKIMIEANKRPELETLFKAAKGMTKSEIEQIVKMIETFKK
jgi:transcriptional regulator with XRE-family HTH domain